MSKQAEKIKNEIKALYKGPLKKPNNVANEYPTLYIKARKVFGSWRKAVESSGIDYSFGRKNE